MTRCLGRQHCAVRRPLAGKTQAHLRTIKGHLCDTFPRQLRGNLRPKKCAVGGLVVWLWSPEMRLDQKSRKGKPSSYENRKEPQFPLAADIWLDVLLGVAWHFVSTCYGHLASRLAGRYSPVAWRLQYLLAADI